MSSVLRRSSPHSSAATAGAAAAGSEISEAYAAAAQNVQCGRAAPSKGRPQLRQAPSLANIPRVGVEISSITSSDYSVVLLLILILIRVAVARVFRLHRLRQIPQCFEIRKHVIVLQHRQVLMICASSAAERRTIRWPRPKPHRRQQQHRRRKRDSRRWRKHRPPALLHRFCRHTRSHAHIKRPRRLDLRQFIQQSRHRAKLIHAQLARPARYRCVSISILSLSFNRPSTYARIRFSIRLQLITPSFFPGLLLLPEEPN